MLSWLANAWRVPELRKRLLFTFLILALYRLGSWVPAPGVDSDTIKDYFNGRGGTILEQLQKEGESGYARINQYTRYLTVGLAFAQATGYAYLFKRAGNLEANTGRLVLIIVTLTAGTGPVVWMGGAF